MSRRARRRDPGRGGDRDGGPATKICPVCALPFANRRKWAARGLWERVVYCSERCRRAAAIARR